MMERLSINYSVIFPYRLRSTKDLAGFRFNCTTVGVRHAVRRLNNIAYIHALACCTVWKYVWYTCACLYCIPSSRSEQKIYFAQGNSFSSSAYYPIDDFGEEIITIKCI